MWQQGEKYTFTLSTWFFFFASNTLMKKKIHWYSGIGCNRNPQDQYAIDEYVTLSCPCLRFFFYLQVGHRWSSRLWRVLVVPGLQWVLWLSSTGYEQAPAGVPHFEDGYLEPSSIITRRDPNI